MQPEDNDLNIYIVIDLNTIFSENIDWSECKHLFMSCMVLSRGIILLYTIYFPYICIEIDLATFGRI